MELGELTDEQWEQIRDFITPPAKTCRPRIEEIFQRLLKGIWECEDRA